MFAIETSYIDNVSTQASNCYDVPPPPKGSQTTNPNIK